MKELFAQEVYIRLAEDQSCFLSTVKYCKFYSKTTEHSLNRPILDEMDEKALVFVRKRPSRWAPPEER